MSALARLWIVPIVALLGIVALAGACGGGDETTTAGATLTDPRSVSTATPWAEPPETVFLEEGEVGAISDGEGVQRSGGTYVVQPGDTPYGICLDFGCDFNELMELNGITDPTKLFVGQELIIP